MLLNIFALRAMDICWMVHKRSLRVIYCSSRAIGLADHKYMLEELFQQTSPYLEKILKNTALGNLPYKIFLLKYALLYPAHAINPFQIKCLAEL